MATRSVTVEWYENSETKGKEVELDAILQLNAEINQEAASLPKQIKQTSANPLSRVSSFFIIENYLEANFLCQFFSILWNKMIRNLFKKN